MRKYFFLFVMLSSNYISGFTQASFQANATPIILRVTIIVPEGVIPHGFVGIVNGRIVAIGNDFRAGIYLVEVTQGKQREILKLIRQ